jgi:hypothetical protein
MKMAEITLDYTVPMTVVVDTDTGEVKRIVLCGDSFQDSATQPTQVFTCNAVVDGEELPEYIDRDHPVAVKAIAAGDLVSLAAAEMFLPFYLSDPETGQNVGEPTYGTVLGTEGAREFERAADIVSERYNTRERARLLQERDDELTRFVTTPVSREPRSRPSALAERRS